MKPGKTYLMPDSLQEALEMTKKYGEDCRLMAGGTDVMPNRFHDNDTAACLVDISGLEELKKIEKTEKHLIIGSLVKLSGLHNSTEIVNSFPVLIEAADAVASPVIRKSATLGGNLLCENRCMFYNQSAWWREAVGYCLKCSGDICIASGGKKSCFSKFVSDTAIALISLDAFVEVVSPDGISQIKLEDIYTGDGVSPRKIKGSSVIRAIYIPFAEGSKSVFKKLRQRQSLEFTSLTTTVTVKTDGKIKVVLGGVDPGPVVLNKTVDDKPEDIITAALKKSRIVDNDVFTRNYRREMIRVFLRRSFNELGIK
ncbi:MAG: FAD binding domain-containing protein [Bacteroidia bacterium]